jgi:tetratricopeptide (TPR) repeat protein
MPVTLLADVLSAADSALSLKDFERAEQLLSQAKRLDPVSIELQVMSARLALMQNQHEEARRILDDVLPRVPKHGEALMLRGLICENSGDVDGALSHFERSTRFGPTAPVAWFNLGRALLGTNRLAEAAMAFERASTLAPENLSFLLTRAQTLTRLGHHRPAAILCLQCIERQVINPFFIVGLAEALGGDGDQSLADELLAAGSKCSPATGVFDSKRSAIALERRDLEGAVRFAREACRRQPDCAEFLLELAELETMRQNFDEARGAAERVLALAPNHWRANHVLGIGFEARGFTEKAISFYRQAARLAPTEVAPLKRLTSLLIAVRSRSAINEAWLLLTRFTDDAPLNPETAALLRALSMVKLIRKTGTKRPALLHLSTVFKAR